MSNSDRRATPPGEQLNEAAPLPRYSTSPFPAYRYVPGRSPHPTRDVNGHSYGRHPSEPAGFTEDTWDRCDQYLFGIDLFNHGYWWEAHEAWEGCWRAAGRDTSTGRFVQALIQTSAACLKKFMGQSDGMQLLAADALDKLPGGAGRRMGIPVHRLRAEIQELLMENGSGYPLIRLDKGSEFPHT